MSSANGDSCTSPPLHQIEMPFIAFSCLNVMARMSNIVLSRRSRSRTDILVLFPLSEGKYPVFHHKDDIEKSMTLDFVGPSVAVSGLSCSQVGTSAEWLQRPYSYSGFCATVRREGKNLFFPVPASVVHFDACVCPSVGGGPVDSASCPASCVHFLLM